MTALCNADVECGLSSSLCKTAGRNQMKCDSMRIRANKLR
jgi:hypothetical protein